MLHYFLSWIKNNFKLRSKSISVFGKNINFWKKIAIPSSFAKLYEDYKFKKKKIVKFYNTFFQVLV